MKTSQEIKEAFEKTIEDHQTIKKLRSKMIEKSNDYEQPLFAHDSLKRIQRH